MKKHIYSLSEDELLNIPKSFGEPAFRGKQLRDWLYKKFATSFDDMINLPKAFREKLRDEFLFTMPKVKSTIVSPQGTAVKFALESEGHIFESVILITEKRRTLCVSSQIGCALGCKFCETAKLGIVRNLSESEVVAQLILANQYLIGEGLKPISNIVFMGMGEALSNFANFERAIHTITNENGIAIGFRKITVSTAGVVPNIYKLIASKLPLELAISLNASDDLERSAIMPVNNKFPIAELLHAAKDYAEYRGRPVTFEYVLIAGKNDSKEAAVRIVSLMKNFPGKINLIPLNDCTTEGLSRPLEESISSFSKMLYDGGVTVTVRRSGAQDIDGACGQLAGSLRKK